LVKAVKPDELPIPVTSATLSSSMNDLTMPSSFATLYASSFSIRLILLPLTPPASLTILM